MELGEEVKTIESRRTSVVVTGLKKLNFEPENEALSRFCWKCYKQHNFEERARKNYDDVMSGHVCRLLSNLIGRWEKDDSFLGQLSLFGIDFRFIAKWTENQQRRKWRKRRSQAKVLEQSVASRRPSYVSATYRYNKQ